MNDFDDDQGDDEERPYRDSYEQAEADGANYQASVERLASAADRFAGSIDEYSGALASSTEQVAAKLDALTRSFAAPGVGQPDPDDRILWQVVGRPVRLGDGRVWILQDRTRRQHPVWGLLDAAMNVGGTLPVSGVFTASIILLQANYRLDLGEARQLIEWTDPYALLPVVLGALKGEDVVPVPTEDRPLMHDDTPEEGDESDPD